jgi:hypothetical protein
MWVQMHIARRRASIDFFLKTEMDKTVIDLYDKFKAKTPWQRSRGQAHAFFGQTSEV